MKPRAEFKSEPSPFRLTVTMVSSVALAAAGLVGCGDDTDAPDGATGDAGSEPDGGVLDGSATDGNAGNARDRYLPAFAPGTRLEVRAVGLSGAPELFRTFYDTTLEVECTFAPATDGTLRCMPRYEFDQTGVRFADSSCAEARYYPTRTDCETRAFHVIARDDERGCDLGRVLEVIRLSPLASLPAQSYARSPDGTCTNSGAFPSTMAFEGTELAPTEFVRGDIVNTGDPGSPGVRVLQAEDGARRILQAYDARYDLGCVPFVFDGSTSSRCLTTPAPRIDPWWYSDAACTEQLAWTNKRPSTCVTPAFGTQAGALVRIDTERTAAIFQGGGAMCSEAATDDYSLWTIYDVAGPGSLADLYEIDFAPFGSGDLVPYFATANDGTLLAPESLWDNTRTSPCEPRVLRDDSLACVPTRVARRESFFADAACTEPAVVTTVGTPDAIVAEEFSQCPLTTGELRVTGVWAVGTEISGTLYEQRLGTCEPFALMTGQRAFRMGSEISTALPVLEDQRIARP